MSVAYTKICESTKVKTAGTPIIGDPTYKPNAIVFVLSEESKRLITRTIQYLVSLSD